LAKLIMALVMAMKMINFGNHKLEARATFGSCIGKRPANRNRQRYEAIPSDSKRFQQEGNQSIINNNNRRRFDVPLTRSQPDPSAIR